VWDRIVHDSPDTWLYHLYDWLKRTEKIWDLESRSFLVENNGEIIGIFPLQMQKGSRKLYSIFMGTGGAAVKNGILPSFREKVMEGMYDHVEQIASENGCPSVVVYLPPLSESSTNNRWNVNPLVNHFYTDISTHSWIVDLTQPKEGIYKNLSENAKRKIREATKKGYKIRAIKSRSEIDILYDIHCETYHRTGATPHPKEYFLSIYDYVVAKNNAKTWVAVDANDNPVAFTNIGTFKKGAFYWTVCCRDEHFKNGVYYLLLWHAIQSAKDDNFIWFDCAEAFPNVRNGKLKGLSEFKSKFGGELHRFYKGSITFDTRVARKTVFENWLKDTELLLQPLLGMRTANLITRLFRKCGYFAAKIARASSARASKKLARQKDSGSIPR